VDNPTRRCQSRQGPSLNYLPTPYILPFPEQKFKLFESWDARFAHGTVSVVYCGCRVGFSDVSQEDVWQCNYFKEMMK